jgi:transposase
MYFYIGGLMKSIFAQGNHKTIQKLSRLFKDACHDKQLRVADRIRAIILSIEGHSAPQISHVLKTNRTTVPIWINNWNIHQEEGLLEGYRSGRHPRISGTQLTMLHDIIESGPIAYGLNTGVWTSIIIKQVIADEFSVVFHAGHVRKILKRLGLSVQRPAYHLVKGEPAEKNKWIRYTYPRLKKKPRRKMP